MYLGVFVFGWRYCWYVGWYVWLGIVGFWDCWILLVCWNLVVGCLVCLIYCGWLVGLGVVWCSWCIWNWISWLGYWWSLVGCLVLVLSGCCVVFWFWWMGWLFCGCLLFGCFCVWLVCDYGRCICDVLVGWWLSND